MSKTKRLEDLENTIRSAIKACGQDFATLEVRNKLLAALSCCDKIKKKRQTRADLPMEQYAAKAINLHKEWWETIEKNVRDKVKEDMNKEKQKKAEDIVENDEDEN